MNEQVNGWTKRDRFVLSEQFQRKVTVFSMRCLAKVAEQMHWVCALLYVVLGQMGDFIHG